MLCPFSYLLSIITLVCAVPLQDSGITWGPCQDLDVKSSLPYDCGNLTVPLDYTEPSSKSTLTLQLVRIPATKAPVKGSILFNFGGPGLTGRADLVSDRLLHTSSTGGVYDLIAFDPRGTGNTIPFTCGHTEASLLDLAIRGDDFAEGTLWANAEVIANACYDFHTETGSLIGTSFYARDLMQVVDALGEDGMLRYYGISYGTLIGATVAAMFPQRIDKLLLDGAVNAHFYYQSFYDFSGGTIGDEMFSAIFSSCLAAGPDRCPLANENATAEALEQKFWHFLDTVKTRPVTLNNTFVLDYYSLKTYVFQNLYNPDTWPRLTSALNELFEGEVGSDVLQLLALSIPTNATALINNEITSSKFLERTDPYRRCLIHNDLDVCQRQGTNVDLSTQLTDPQPLSTPLYTPNTSVSDVSSSYEFPDILLFEHAC